MLKTLFHVACINALLKSALVWDITHHVVIIICGRLGDNLIVPFLSVKKSRKEDKIISGQPISPIFKRQEIQKGGQDYFGTTHQSHLKASRNPERKTRLFRDNPSVLFSSAKKFRKEDKIISGQPISPIFKRQEIQKGRQDYFGTTNQSHFQAPRNPGRKTRLFRKNYQSHLQASRNSGKR